MKLKKFMQEKTWLKNSKKSLKVLLPASDVSFLRRLSKKEIFYQIMQFPKFKKLK